MEESIWKMAIESIPFMSKALLWGVVIGFLVHLFMKLYARLEKIEATVGQLILWVPTVEERFTKIDNRLINIETRLDNLEKRVESMDEKFDRKFDTIIQLITSNQETAIRLFHTAIESAQGRIPPTRHN